MKVPFFLLLLTFFLSCTSPASQANFNIIPFPDELNTGNDFSKITSFSLPQELSIYNEWIEEWNPNPRYILQFKEDKNLAYDYILSIEKEEIFLQSKSIKDARNGLSTLWQLKEINNGKFPISTIQDEVEFDYRGMHLDVCRHMFSVSEIKKYIDYLSFYKFNNFHWHLTEDQGWRIEIKKYPKLQTIAAYRNETLIGHYNDQPHKYDGKRYGGFYTQEEVKEVVAYAQNRGIRVIPEIELPGHAQAAIAAYPELGCTGEKVEVATKWGVFNEVYCPSEKTFTFLKDVMGEIITLFPSEYIHIGGDECQKDSWKKSSFCQQLMKQNGLKDEYELQSYFIGEIADYLKTKGKTIIGWDEILEGGLNEGSLVMSWRGEKGGIEAAKAGHEVIMTPGSHCYFDHYQSSNPDEPLAIGGLTTLEDVYNYHVIPSELSAEESKYIIGAQGNVWTEYMKDFSKVEYMALARMLALSEVLWNHPSKRDYKAFKNRFISHHNYWKNRNVPIANHLFDIKTKVISKEGEGSVVIMEPPFTEGSIIYKNPSGEIIELKEFEVKLKEEGIHQFHYQSKDGENGNKNTIFYKPHLLNDASIKIKNPPSKSYSGADESVLINGINGSDEKYGGPEWHGYSGVDFEGMIMLNKPNRIKHISLRFFKGEGQWIYLPKKVIIQGSMDGNNFTNLTSTNTISTDKKIAEVDFKVNSTVKYLKIVAENHGIIAEGKQGGGHKAWLFIDEIRVN